MMHTHIHTHARACTHAHTHTYIPIPEMKHLIPFIQIYKSHRKKLQYDLGSFSMYTWTHLFVVIGERFVENLRFKR